MNRPRNAFTLIELLVVIAIIGVLVAMLLPALDAAREASRRSMCSHRMMQVSLALQSYQSAFELLPPGVTNLAGPIRNLPDGMHQSWVVRLLPYLEEPNLARLADLSVSVYDPKNAKVRAAPIETLICPAESQEAVGSAPGGANCGRSNYAGCHNDLEAPIDTNNRGVMFLNSEVRPEDIKDGLAHTIFVGEKQLALDDLGWMSGTRATLRNAGTPLNETFDLARSKPLRPDDPVPGYPKTVTRDLYVGGFGSYHPGPIVMFAFGDGAVKGLSTQVDQRTLQQLANRADGALVQGVIDE